ncbi:MAG TPA: PHP domain-containing protein [Cellulomonadaceae bacterium]|nr:PHP domain-containing protein [Cellulomonadaceae bacterium]
MRIDLHTHSTASDGTDTPTRVVEQAVAAGLDVIALTDHDTTDGWAEAAEAAVAHGIGLVRGSEVTASAAGISVHLLSYLQDPTSAPLADAMRATKTARITRARTMVDLLAEDYDLTWEDVVAQTASGATVGRPHIADALVAKGIVHDRSAAFTAMLLPTSRYYVRHRAPTALEVIDLVLTAGGVPVLAHPGAEQRGRVLSDVAIEELAEAGLVGLEVYHRDNSPDQVERLAGIAARLGLLATGSSDFHGAGKPNVLGENLTDPEVLARVEERGAIDVVRG